MNREESPDWLWPMAFEKRGERREKREMLKTERERMNGGDDEGFAGSPHLTGGSVGEMPTTISC